MAPRAYWKGHVRLALVSFPVRLYAAVTSTERISLHRIHRETHERVRMQNVVPDVGPVEREDIVMGYEHDRDSYVPVEEDELEALEVASKHTIDLSRFVDLSAIDPIYFDKPYYVAPDGDIATEAFVTIRDALDGAGKVALGQIVLSKRERIVAIRPHGKGLILSTLRFADEVRAADAYFEDIEDVDVSADQVEMARSLIEARSGEFEPETFVDNYQAALRALIEEKVKGGKVRSLKETPRAKSNVINLMDALKASLDDGGGGGKKGASRKGASRKGAGAATSKSSSDADAAPRRRTRATRKPADDGAKATRSKASKPKTAERQRKSA